MKKNHINFLVNKLKMMQSTQSNLKTMIKIEKTKVKNELPIR